MKTITILIFFLFYIRIYSQNMLIGKYHDFFGSKLELNHDSTFLYTWDFDLMFSWTQGKWINNHDTIFFTAIPIYDTLRYYDDKLKITHEKLVLSIDDKTDVINKEQFDKNQEITNGGQNWRVMPKKLYFKNGKLFELNSQNKPIKKKFKGIWSKRKFVPWYVKINN
jgi:hypothetical protein